MWQLSPCKTGSSDSFGRQGLFCFLLLWCCWSGQETLLAQQAGDLRPHAFSLGEPAGFHQFRPGCWGIVSAEVWNPTKRPVRILAATTFEMDQTTQYGREFWVPAEAKRKVSYPVHVPDKIEEKTRRLKLLSRIYDRTDGKNKLLRRKRDHMWHESSARVFSRDNITAYYPDYAEGEDGVMVSADQFFDLVEPALDPVLEAIKVTRRYMNIKDWRHIPTLDKNDDLPWPLALGAIDQLVLGGNRLATEPEAREAIRGWVNQGGRLWIMLDKTDLKTVRLLLGDAFSAYLVDEVSLSQYQIIPHQDMVNSDPELREVEVPVKLSRLVTEGVDVSHSVDGWPAAVWLKYGDGEILFTALELRAWSRPRRELIIRPRGIPGQVLDTPPLQQLAERFFQQPQSRQWSEEDFQQYIGEQIGYQIVTKEWIIAILGSFCGILLVAGFWLSHVRHLERMLWIGPLAAACTAMVLAGMGKMSRESVASTVAVVQWVAPVSQSQFVPVTGLAAIYSQRASEDMIGVQQGGVLWPQMGSSDTTTSWLVWTDHGQSQWEKLTLPEGVRKAVFHQFIPVKQPLGARASLTSQGLSGRVQVKPFEQISDALLVTPGGDRYTVRVEGDQFTSGPEDRLKEGDFFGSGLIVKDEQRHRQQVLEQLLGSAEGRKPHVFQRPTILAWSKPVAIGLAFPQQHERLGSALLALPLNLEATPRGEEFVLPPWLCPIQTVVGKDGSRASELYDNKRKRWAGKNFDQRRVWLRIQLPRQVLPAALTEAVVTMDVEFQEFDLQLLSVQDEELTVSQSLTDPVGSQTVTINQSDMLQLDADGGLLIVVQAVAGKGQTEKGKRAKKYTWHIRDFSVELRGQRLAP
jgi:hypothetical protein